MDYPELAEQLYHGSTETVSVVDLSNSAQKKDFGPGFYTTNDKIQAEKFALLKTNRAKTSKGYVSVFAFQPTEELQIKKFLSSDEEWFDFVLHNRGYNSFSSAKTVEKFDIIIGPVANDAVGIVLNLFVSGTYGEQTTPEAKETAIRLLLTQNLHNQVFFGTEKAVKQLTFLEAYDVHPY